MGKFVDFFHNFSMFSRRQHRRYKVTKPIECVCVFTKSGEKLEQKVSLTEYFASMIEYSVALVDISQSGFCISLGDNEILPDTECEFKFQLPDRIEQLCVRGKVRWSTTAAENSPCRAGIEFQDANEEDIKTLFTFLSKKSK